MARTFTWPTLLALILLLIAHPANACLFNGGLACPEDCARDGGKAICTDPEPVQDSTGIASTDPDLWKYHNCDYNLDTAANAATWCAAAGGQWPALPNWQCDNLSLPPFIYSTGYTEFSPLEPTADAYVTRKGLCQHTKSTTSWGITRPAGDRCWEGGPNNQYGIRSSEARIVTYTGNTRNQQGQCNVPATQVIAQLRQRVIGCPKNYALRTWPNGTSRCYLETEDTCLVGNPVRPFAGTKLESFPIDAGPQFTGLLTLEYSSTARPATASPTLLGRNWGLAFQKRLATESGAAGLVRVIVHAVGQPDYFGADGWSLLAKREGKTRLIQEGSLTHWIDTKSQRWTFDATGALTAIRRTDGTIFQVTYAGNVTTLATPEGRNVTVNLKTPTRFEIASGGIDAAVLLLRTNGNVETIQRAGTAVTLAYSDPRFPDALTAIQDETGRTTASYVYGTDGKVINEYHWPNGTATHNFAFSRANTNVQVTWPLNGQTTYVTTVAGGVRRLSSVSQFCPTCPSGNVASYIYDPQGQLSQTTSFNGIQTTHLRNSAGWPTFTTEVSNTTCPAGFPNCQQSRRTVEKVWATDYQIPLTTIVRAGGTDGPIESMARTVINARGQTIATCRVDPSDAVAMSYVCGSAAHAPARVRQSVFRYCETSDPDFGTAACPTEGRLRSVDGPRTDVADLTVYSYRAANDPGCTSQPVNCTYRRGDLWKTTNAVGHVVENVAFDNLGRLTRQRDANQTITDLQYHARGWLTSRTIRANADGSPSAGDAQTRIEHEVYGEIKRVISPDGSGLEYCRDQVHRITAVVMTTLSQSTQCNGAVPLTGTTSIRFTLDNQGNRIREESRDSSDSVTKLLARQYNSLGQLRSLVNSRYANQPDLDSASVKKYQYTYDVNGNSDLTTDPNGVISDQNTDPLNRLIMEIHDKDIPGGSAEIDAHVGYEYDAAGRLRKVTDPNGLETDYTIDGLGDQVSLNSPDTKLTLFTYDAAGNRSSQIDARGVEVTFGYDALNRITSQWYSGDPSLNNSFQYDQVQSECAADEGYPNGRLTRFTDKSGETRLCYDQRGNLRRKVQVTAGQTLAVGYTYDLSDRIASITYPSGNTVSYGRDANGRVQSVSFSGHGTNMTLVSSVSYRPFGPISSIQFGNGQILSKQWDLDYWPDAVSSPAFTYDFVTNDRGDITQVLSPEGNQTLQYDNLQRLKNVMSGPSVVEALAYDKTGNRLSRQTSSGTVAYGYADPTSHWLTSVGVSQRTYDEVGNTVAGHIPAGKDLTFQAVYSEANRLIEILGIGTGKAAGTTYWRWLYNARGERVNGGQVTGPMAMDPWKITIFAETGRFLSEFQDWGQSSPPQFEDIVWIDDTPVAQIETVQAPTGTVVKYVRYIHSDHLNTPRALLNARTQDLQPSGTVVWRWRLNQSGGNGSNAFGAQAAEQDPDNNKMPVVFDMRFPGQLYDAATGLHYNYFRDYEPGTGRYVESDPIGLKGEIATFNYAQGSPLKFIDSFGLRPCPAGMVDPGVPCWIDDGDGKPSGYPNEGRCVTAECAAGILPNPTYSPSTLCQLECNFKWQWVCSGASIGTTLVYNPMAGGIVAAGCILTKIFVCHSSCSSCK